MLLLSLYNSLGGLLYPSRGLTSAEAGKQQGPMSLMTYQSESVMGSPLSSGCVCVTHKCSLASHLVPASDCPQYACSPMGSEGRTLDPSPLFLPFTRHLIPNK